MLNPKMHVTLSSVSPTHAGVEGGSRSGDQIHHRVDMCYMHHGVPKCCTADSLSASAVVALPTAELCSAVLLCFRSTQSTKPDCTAYMSMQGLQLWEEKQLAWKPIGLYRAAHIHTCNHCSLYNMTSLNALLVIEARGLRTHAQSLQPVLNGITQCSAGFRGKRAAPTRTATAACTTWHHSVLCWLQKQQGCAHTHSHCSL